MVACRACGWPSGASRRGSDRRAFRPSGSRRPSPARRVVRCVPQVCAEFARHRLIEIAAGERLGRSAHITEPLGRHQHEHVRSAAADVLAFAAMALRLEPRLALGRVTHLPAIASALERHLRPLNRGTHRAAKLLLSPFARQCDKMRRGLSPHADLPTRSLDHRPHRRGRGDRAAGGGDQGTGRERARRSARNRSRSRSRPAGGG